jgi:ABC-type nitrate/sulfonate/bicarbonate transport system substrate-binding protein
MKDDPMRQHFPRRSTRASAVVAAAAAIAGLTAFGGTPATTEPPADGDVVVAGAPIPEGRCEANRDAGTITYLTGFDFAATAGMIGVFVAQERGYFDELCLDIEIAPNFSTANYPLVAGGEAQIASGGSFSEVLNFAAANDADLVTLTVEGRSPIDALILKPGTAESLEDLQGTTIGVKGKLPPSIAAMLASVGLIENEDYSTVLLDGFDPVAHIGLDDIVGFPGYKSNEPGALDRAGIAYDLFDPIDFDIPGSFGVNFTSREFLDEHPTAVQDFVRASMRGLADAIADPEAASTLAMDLVTAGGNPNYLSPEGEAFRWDTESALLRESYGDGEAFGVPSLELLQAEVDAYTEVGVFETEPPALADVVAVDLVAAVYDDEQQVVWPG